MAFETGKWADGEAGGTPITAAELNRIEAAGAAASAAPTWAQVSGKPSTFPPAIGTTAATALAGNTALLQIGTTATTAKAGNYVPAWADVTGKPTIPAATAAGTRAQLDAGTDTTVRAFSAKDIAEYVAAQIAAIPAA